MVGVPATHRVAAAVPIPFHANPIGQRALPFPPTTGYCLQNFHRRCYQPAQPAQLVKAYDLAPLHNAGIDGHGKTIVIVESFGSPTIAHDLHVFDQTFGLPDPPLLTVRHDAGPVPPFNPTNPEMVGAGQRRPPWTSSGPTCSRRVRASSSRRHPWPRPRVSRASRRSCGPRTTSSTTTWATSSPRASAPPRRPFPSPQALLELRSAFENAARHDVTVLASSGDSGATSNQSNARDLYPTRVTSWPPPTRWSPRSAAPCSP